MTAQVVLTEETTIPEELHAALQERVSTDAIDVPMLPDVVWQVMNLTSSEHADARQLAELIQHDQALASHMLRVANSPAYKPRTPIVSLQQAISRLGLKQLAEIAFAISVQSRVFEAPGYEQEIRRLWQHAIATAVFASEIARLRRSNVEGAFLCGLLHDIGKPIILQLLVDFEQHQHTLLVPTVVAALMETYHAQVGGLLAAQWSLPPNVQESILYHHDYTRAPTCGDAVRITCFADLLAEHLMEPEVCETASVFNHPVLAELHIYPAEVETLLGAQDKVRRAIEAMS
jgi:putative nucleotidyltransferase with HDIG domain